MISNETRFSILQVENFIFDNEQSFVERFFNFSTDAELVRLSISSTKLYFTVVTFEGQHIGYDCTISEYNDWYSTIVNNKESEKL